MSNCLCGGSGNINDWSKQGDPCPECSGQKMSQRAQNNMTRSVRRWGRHGGVVDVPKNTTGASAEKTAKKTTGKATKDTGKTQKRGKR